MFVLIAGCGYVGSALARELVADGHRVLGLRRDVGALPDGVAPMAADLTRPESLRALPAEIDSVVYAASAGGRTEAAYEDAYVRGVGNVLDALQTRGAPVRRVVFVSSTAVYGQDDGAFIDETSPTEPETFTGRALLRGEALVSSGPFPATRLRLSGIYGPGRTWLVRRVHQGLAEQEPAAPGAAPRYGNRIHQADCAGALRHLLTLDAVEDVYLGVDDAPAPLSEVHAFVARLLEARGAVVARAGAGDPAEGRGGNKRCRNDRLLGSGYRLRVPSYREGYPAIVDAYLASLAR